MNMIIRVRKNISIHISISIREELIRTCQSISVGILILTVLLVLASVLAFVLAVVCILVLVLVLLLT